MEPGNVFSLGEIAVQMGRMVAQSLGVLLILHLNVLALRPNWCTQLFTLQ